MARSGRSDQALAFVRDMRVRGMKPSVEAYNAVIASCERAGRMREALPLLEEMRLMGIQVPSVHAFIFLRCAQQFLLIVVIFMPR